MYSSFKASTSPVKTGIFNPASVKFVTIPESVSEYKGKTRPRQISVCTNSTGFSIKDGVVVKSQDGEPFPSPALIVNILDENIVVVMDTQLNVKGIIKVFYNTEGMDYTDDYDRNPHISGVYLDDYKQRILTLDTNYGCVYVKELDGSNKTTLYKGYNCPVKATFDATRTFICERDHVKVLDSESYSLLSKITHSTLENPYGIYLTSTSIFVNCCNYCKTGKVLQFSSDKYELVGQVETNLNEAHAINAFSEDSLLAVDLHRLVQFSVNGEIQAEFGSEFKGNGDTQLDLPLDLCLLKTEKENFVFVCDTNNYRIAVFDI